MHSLSPRRAAPRARTRRAPLGTGALLVMAALALPTAAGAETRVLSAPATDTTTTGSVRPMGDGGTNAAAATNLKPGREGSANAQSVLITLSSQATEIRQILMEGGEPNADGLAAAERAREVATQAVEATGILGNPGDPQVTTTRMSDMDAAHALFRTIEEELERRIVAIRAGDEAEANRARLAAIQAINELPDRIRFEGRAARGDNPTAAPGGAQPILQQ